MDLAAYYLLSLNSYKDGLKVKHKKMQVENILKECV